MSTTRRTLLAGFAAIPAASLPAPAETSPDAALLARAGEVDTVGYATDAAYARLAEAERLKVLGLPSPDLAAAKAAEDAADTAWAELRDFFVATPARTLDGIKLKARLAAQGFGTDLETAQSIVDDLVALDGRRA